NHMSQNLVAQLSAQKECILVYNNKKSSMLAWTVIKLKKKDIGVLCQYVNIYFFLAVATCFYFSEELVQINKHTRHHITYIDDPTIVLHMFILPCTRRHAKNY
ncbi:hypothetical protein ACJX0J_016094, partial [Zea mays]